MTCGSWADITGTGAPWRTSPRPRALLRTGGGARDPGHAPAYAGLAEVLALSTQYGAVSFEDALPRASAAATHAVELDDNLAEAHAILGFIELAGRRWRPSEAEFRRALAIDPSLAEAHHWIAYLLFFLDRRDEAVAEIAKARALNPLSAVTNADEGHFLLCDARL